MIKNHWLSRHGFRHERSDMHFWAQFDYNSFAKNLGRTSVANTQIPSLLPIFRFARYWPDLIPSYSNIINLKNAPSKPEFRFFQSFFWRPKVG